METAVQSDREQAMVIVMERIMCLFCEGKLHEARNQDCVLCVLESMSDEEFNKGV